MRSSEPRRGRYVPAKNGFPPGVMIMVRGQPPLPVITWQAVMYTRSMSGRSSRSTLMETNDSFSTRATSSLSNDSRSMTWHQWQAA